MKHSAVRFRSFCCLLVLILAGFGPSFGPSRYHTWRDAVAAEEKAQGTVPDVVILVLSGGLPSDGVSFTYRDSTAETMAREDLKALLQATGWAAKDAKVTTSGTPKMTSVEFMVDSAVNWGTGTLLLEPFATTFKRYNLVQVNYVLQGSFQFHSITNHSDKNADITYTNKNNSQTYTIKIKNHNFDRLDLPVTQTPPAASGQEKVAENTPSDGTRIWWALIIALAAGAIVFGMVSRMSRK